MVDFIIAVLTFTLIIIFIYKILLKKQKTLQKNELNNIVMKQENTEFQYEPVLMKKYKVKGTNENTNRKKTITVSAKSEELDEKAALEQRILPPYEIQLDFTPPTERQIEFAKSLYIAIPEMASSLDVSYLISKKTDNDSDPNPGLLEFADNRNLLFSKYIGKKMLYNLVFENLESEDKIAFFAFCVYRWLSDDRHANLDTHENKNIFYEFAKSMINDESFVKSLNRYKGEDLRYFGKLIVDNDGYEVDLNGGSINTIAYKKTSEFISNQFNTPLRRTKTLY